MDVEAEVRMDEVLLVMSLDRVGRPFGEVLTEFVGVEAPSWSSPSPPLSLTSRDRLCLTNV